MKDNKKTIQLIVIFTMIFAVVGGTLAYWQWTTDTEQQTNVVFTVTQDFSCAADGGGNISHTDVKLAPTSCTDATRAIKRKVIVTPTLDRDNLTVSLDLWLTIDELGEGLKKSNNFRYVLTTSATSCEEGEIISEGNFKGRKPGDKIRLITNDLHTVTPTPEEYYLYIWLDAAETNSNTMNQRFSMSLGGVCDEVETLVGDAYAIYTEGNQTLTFLRSENEITKGSTYNGQTITEVYSGFETDVYLENCTAPWYEYSRVIENIIFKNTIRPAGTAYWFEDFVNAKAMDLTLLDTSKVINMESMFYFVSDPSQGSNHDGVTLIGLENWDTSNVTNMTDMFFSALTNSVLDLSNWDTSNVTNMSGMFWDYYISDVGDISNWDVSKVTNMSSLFQTFTINSELDLSSWNTSNVTNMEYMFYGITLNTDLDLSNLDTSSVTNMLGMFSYSTIDKNLYLSNWDVSNVTNMNEMFWGSIINTNLDLSNWNVSNVIHHRNFNYEISGTGTLTPPNFNTTS